MVLSGDGIPTCLTAEQVGKVMAGIYRNWDAAAYAGFCKRFELPAKKKYNEYSTGMKMKLCLAVALSHHPKLLLLDEATSGLDPLPTQTRPSNWTPIPVPKARVPPEKKPYPRPFCPPPEQTRAVPVQLPRLRRSRSAAERPDRAAPQAPCSFAALHRTIFVSLPLPPPECVEMCRFYLTVFRAVCQSFRQRFAPKFFSENWADSTILIVSGRERPLPAVLRVSSLTKSR